MVPLIKGKGVFKKNEWFEMEMERVEIEREREY